MVVHAARSPASLSIRTYRYFVIPPHPPLVSLRDAAAVVIIVASMRLSSSSSVTFLKGLCLPEHFSSLEGRAFETIGRGQFEAALSSSEAAPT